MGAVEDLAGEVAFEKKSLQLKIEEANRCIDYAYKMAPKLFSAYSAGKDSAVQTHLIALRNPVMEARILTDWSSRLMYPEIDNIIQWWRVRFPSINIIDVYIAPLPEHRTYKEYELYRRTKNIFINKPDGSFFGMRADESASRRIALRKRLKNCEFPIYKYVKNKKGNKGGKGGTYRICFLEHWRTSDIAAYIQKYRIPVLQDYYEDEKFDARSKTHLSEMEWVLSRQIPELRRRHPENYNILITRFPELDKWG